MDSQELKPVVKPSYYKAEGYELDILDVITMFKLGFAEGNVVKYVARWQDKGGVEDLKKAREYLDRLINVHDTNIKRY
ncbi:DUF3310 domain-containing protein [bacterium]|nr:DUF3310 domain-containing protein [bacterium]